MRDLNNNSRKRKWGIWIIKEKNFWKTQGGVWFERGSKSRVAVKGEEAS